MIYTKQLKDTLIKVEEGINSGDTKAALSQLEMAKTYADHHKFSDPRIVKAIQRTAKELNISEPEAIESLLIYGLFEAGRIVVGGGFSILGHMMEERKLETVQVMLPLFGVDAMTAAEESAEHARIIAEKRG